VTKVATTPRDGSGKPPAPPGELAPGDVVDGRYRVIAPLGTGGMGAVYVVEHQQLSGKHFALKLLHPRFSTDKDVRERFKREGVASARSQHPNVVEVTDLGQHGGADYLVMELLQGQSLRQKLAEAPDRRLGLEETLAVLLPAMVGTHAAHAQGVVHRDLKPDNIFLSRKGMVGTIVPKVLDFGIAKDMTDAQGASGVRTETGVGMGTFDYMAPEQMNAAKDVDARADQYALGVVLFECLTGACPKKTQVMLRNYDKPSQLVAGLPGEIDDIVARMLMSEPGDRFDDLKEVARRLTPYADAKTRDEVLREFRESPPVPAAPAAVASPSYLTPAPVPATTIRPTRRFRLSLAGIAIAMTAAVTSVLILGARPAVKVAGQSPTSQPDAGVPAGALSAIVPAPTGDKDAALALPTQPQAAPGGRTKPKENPTSTSPTSSTPTRRQGRALEKYLQ
jgi:eukaryotic-like serine/threonine-protein kinase